MKGVVHRVQRHSSGLRRGSIQTASNRIEFETMLDVGPGDIVEFSVGEGKTQITKVLKDSTVGGYPSREP